MSDINRTPYSYGNFKVILKVPKLQQFNQKLSIAVVIMYP